MNIYEERNKITYKQIDIMKHAIGFSNGRIRGNKHRKYVPFRNYFCCGEADLDDWNKLVAIGYAENWNNNYYGVTDKGKEFLYFVTGVLILDDLK